jgi:hypothetical protein
MKNNNFISFVTALVIGLIIGGGVIGLIWHHSLKSVKIEGSKIVKEITAQEKETYRNDFKKKAKRNLWSITKISLGVKQYEAMEYLLKKNPSLGGFRLYPGLVGDPEEVIVVCAVDPQGADDGTVPPILTPVEPCPPICDDPNSPDHN